MAKDFVAGEFVLVRISNRLNGSVGIVVSSSSEDNLVAIRYLSGSTLGNRALFHRQYLRKIKVNHIEVSFTEVIDNKKKELLKELEKLEYNAAQLRNQIEELE